MASSFTFENLYRAYLDCRRKKRSNQTALAFEVNAEEQLSALTRELRDRTYRPSPSFCFVARNDKHREVFAAEFRDRVVHHLLVRRLEKIWEPIFIYDSFACRKGKGTHGAVSRLKSFTRKVTANNTRPAWCAQLDIRSFFPSIDREILLSLVLSRLQDDEFRWLSKVLILHDPTEAPVFTCSPRKWKDVPPYKSLFSVPAGKGLPIGNLTSQFFANVYLNGLDQFVKHTLKVRWYIRYVDDMVLLHRDRQIVREWAAQMAEYLKNRLMLDFHPHRQKIMPVKNGINFVGYIVRPSHLYIRRRVVRKCKDVVRTNTRNMIRESTPSTSLVFMPDTCLRLQCTLNSYLGAFSHASCHRLAKGLFQKNPALHIVFKTRGFKAVVRWNLPWKPGNLYTQYCFFRRKFKGLLFFQVGNYLELYNKDALWAIENMSLKRISPRKRFYARCGIAMKHVKDFHKRVSKHNALYVLQTGQMCGRLMERVGAAMTLRFPIDSLPDHTRYKRNFLDQDR